MMENDPGPSTTEDVPSAPGWVENEVDEILATLPQQPVLATLRNAYLDCLAGARGGDLDANHDRCRTALLEGLEQQLGVGNETRRALEQKLEALETEITERI